MGDNDAMNMINEYNEISNQALVLNQDLNRGDEVRDMLNDSQKSDGIKDQSDQTHLDRDLIVSDREALKANRK